MRIFVCPLDWGLGHAARCVPIIRYLIEKKMEVVIGAEGKHLVFLKEHFPTLEYVEFPGYRISYSNALPVGMMVFLQVPHMVGMARKEHELLNKLIKEKKIDAVFSDNRYGLWSEKIPCAIMSHQLNIQSRIFSGLASWVTHIYIKRFNECWIPDYEGEENLSGILSHPIPKGINGKYIGSLSRFQPEADAVIENNKYDLLVILSGPEPQRTKLEELILKELKTLPSLKTLIIQGLPGHAPVESGLSNVELVPHLGDKEFRDKVNCSQIILCRAGYSTLMDLNAIGWKKSIFIPTPGQTEQEYLGKLMEKKGLGVTFHQREFSLKNALEKVEQINPPRHYNKEIYKEVIDAWLGKSS